MQPLSDKLPKGNHENYARLFQKAAVCRGNRNGQDRFIIASRIQRRKGTREKGRGLRTAPGRALFCFVPDQPFRPARSSSTGAPFHEPPHCSSSKTESTKPSGVT